MSQNTLSENSKINELNESNSSQSSHTVERKTKLIQMVKENPLVLAGNLIVMFAFSYGVWNFYYGKKRTSYYMMNTRLAGHSAALVGVLGALLTKIKFNKSDEHSNKSDEH